MWEDIIRDSERIQALEKVKTDNVVSYRGILKYVCTILSLFSAPGLSGLSDIYRRQNGD